MKTLPHLPLAADFLSTHIQAIYVAKNAWLLPDLPCVYLGMGNLGVSAAQAKAAKYGNVSLLYQSLIALYCHIFALARSNHWKTITKANLMLELFILGSKAFTVSFHCNMVLLWQVITDYTVVYSGKVSHFFLGTGVGVGGVPGAGFGGVGGVPGAGLGGVGGVPGAGVLYPGVGGRNELAHIQSPLKDIEKPYIS